ncbi:MAG: hypothetical protein U0175_37330 [Caldilineaceae bacterium]
MTTRSTTSQQIRRVFEANQGVLRLAPAWVPRSFCIPGKRMKLHPSDIYAYGAQRGGIDERWLASTTKADNGPLTTFNEGVSQVVANLPESATPLWFTDVVEELNADLLGNALWSRYQGWPVFAKFFDNQNPIPFHMHQKEEHARLVNQQPKPESYYFPSQMNNHGGDAPFTYFGLEPGTSKEQIRRCLEDWERGNNQITALSKAYRLELGTGWYIPAGVLHAPGSLCTYEPQWASDVSALFENFVGQMPVERDLLVKSVPDDKKNDYDFLVSMLDWEENVQPNFKAKHFRPPLPVKPLAEMESNGYVEHWISYGNPFFAGKELTVLPGRSVTLRESGPFGFIAVQGFGSINGQPIETPTLIRFGQQTYDEYFVAASVAQAGVTIHNPSKGEPLVLLKHFGPGSDAP